MTTEPSERIERSVMDCRPLLTVLEKITAAGRARKQAGMDDEAVKYARLARLGVEYFKADEAGNVDSCIELLDKINAMTL